MKKEMQLKKNEMILEEIVKINAEMETGLHCVGRLRSCSATVYETENYYLLKSYSTFICAIDKTSDIIYDFLRYVYGYTSTSAQHIAKFRNDYTSYINRVELTYRPV